MHRVTLRPVEPGDDELLYRLYAGTRAAELRLLDWGDEAKETFLRQQFAAQCAAYEQYPGRSFQAILLDDEPVGRLYLAHWEREIRIVDIALLPEHCGAGIGTALLRRVLDEAAAAGKAVTIHVEGHNPALRLYERLGFSVVEDKGVYLLLEAAPQVKTAS
jgi:ribosomal protein S18 acetylase RimI-like enzyme